MWLGLLSCAFQVGRTSVFETLSGQVGGAKYCRGFGQQVCLFGEGGRRARPHGPAQCLFCDVNKLNDALLDAQGSVTVKKRFACLTDDAKLVALDRVQDAGFRRWLQGSCKRKIEEAEPTTPRAKNVAAKPHGLAQAAAPYAPELLEEIYEQGKNMWATALQERRAFNSHGIIFPHMTSTMVFT